MFLIADDTVTNNNLNLFQILFKKHPVQTTARTMSVCIVYTLLVKKYRVYRKDMDMAAH